MTEEFSPFLLSFIFIVEEVKVPLGLSSKIRLQVDSIFADFNKTLQKCQKNIEDISFFLPNKYDFVRYIDLGVLINREYAIVSELCNSTIQEKAPNVIIELSSIRLQKLTRKDIEAIDLLIAKLKDVPESVFFIELQNDHIAAGSLIGKTIQSRNVDS